MEKIIASLLLVTYATALPYQSAIYLKSTRSGTMPNIQLYHESALNKTVNLNSVASFCASHPFAGGCELEGEVQNFEIIEDRRQEDYHDDEEDYEDVENIPELLTVAFFCSSHPSAIGCPAVNVGDDPGSFNINTLSAIKIRFCILHPTSYGCPKLGVIRSPPSLQLPLPLPPPLAALDDRNTNQTISELRPDTYPAVIQPNDVSVLTEYLNFAPELTSDADSLIANESHDLYEISVNEGENHLTEITGRSVGNAPVILLNDQDSIPDESLQQMIQVFESAKVTRPKAVLSLPPPVDAIFAAGRYAWQKTATPARSATPEELIERLKMGKMKPLPSVKQVLGALAL